MYDNHEIILINQKNVVEAYINHRECKAGRQKLWIVYDFYKNNNTYSKYQMLASIPTWIWFSELYMKYSGEEKMLGGHVIMILLDPVLRAVRPIRHKLDKDLN